MNLLVKPTGVLQNSQSPPPLGLLYIAAMDDSNTEVYDDTITPGVFEYIDRTRPEIVGVQTFTPGRQDSYRVLRYAKEKGAITVIGGPHASVMRKQLETFDFIDYIVMGDGEYPWMSIVKKQASRVMHGHIEDLDQLPLPAWHKIDIHKYDPNTVAIVLGRGCEGDCTYCSTWWVNGKYRAHGKDWIEAELEVMESLGLKQLIWQDDCLTNDRNAIYGLIDALSRHPFRNLGCTRVDMVDREMLKDMKKVGFIKIAFGIESGSQTILNIIRKHTNLEQALQVREWCRELGIGFTALMMTGFPFETDETRREDREFRHKLSPDEWGSMGHIVVLPGTKIYRDLKAEGKIDDDFWLGNEPYYRLG